MEGNNVEKQEAPQDNKPNVKKLDVKSLYQLLQK